ncbi:helix-turn-helix domain-containing protein [Streptomyces sp. ME02-7008A-1]|uniref:helix-turn-helix domain-containing protein n=1 Tax=unclassified Streptomyces TaxID=2593676 RepID=UPI0029A9E8AB|nr:MULTISPECIES: helix-turn-helix domain-containing protein [unclassified Streptomyces]MDX3180612.1 helix-turn-helix domain-containing protein [Streptomyces sp. ME02-7008A-1]MDX3301353.1 helix-turn-helix domain-containing protein [Streptomyces sp. ME02-7008A]
MSADARDWVWEHSSSRGAARLVLLSIADRVADDQCISWASLSSLAKRTRASVSTVREAVERLLLASELEQLDDLVGPQRSTVYRLPLAAEAVAHALREQRQEEGDTEVSDEPAAPAKLRLSALRRYGIRPREVPESPARGRKPAVPETGRSRRKPAQRRTGHRHSDVPATGTQNRSEPDLNRRYSSGAAVTSAAEWQVDPATHTWTRQQGHLDRLGEQGLQSADAKWRAHRAGHAPRPAEAWAADWRSWITREHAPSRPNLHAVPGKNTAAPGGMTRAEAHTAALLAALDEPTGLEG